MGVRGELSPARDFTRGNKSERSGACRVEVAEVHVEGLDLPRPVTRTPEIYYPFRAVAQHPTGINMRLTEGLGSGELMEPLDCPAEYVRSVYLNPPVGEAAGKITKHIAIPPHIADAATNRAKPIYLRRVVCQRCACHRKGSPSRSSRWKIKH